MAVKVLHRSVSSGGLIGAVVAAVSFNLL